MICYHTGPIQSSILPYFVYILASRMNGTLYVGVTNDLARRIAEHREGRAANFTRKNKTFRLVFAESFDEIGEAIATEKRLKKWHRSWKIQLIEKSNPEWNDLHLP